MGLSILPQNVKEYFSERTEQLKVLAFGENNTRIDHLLDWFYNLYPEKRAKLILYSTISSVFIAIFVVLFYFFALYSMQNKLNSAVDSIDKINTIKPGFMAVQQQFLQIITGLRSNQSSSIISTITGVLQSHGVTAKEISKSPKLSDLSVGNPLKARFQRFQVDLMLENLSIKKIMDIIVTIQNLPNKYEVSEIEITQVNQNKLYFQVNMSIEGYISSDLKLSH